MRNYGKIALCLSAHCSDFLIPSSIAETLHKHNNYRLIQWLSFNRNKNNKMHHISTIIEVNGRSSNFDTEGAEDMMDRVRRLPVNHDNRHVSKLPTYLYFFRIFHA